MKDADLDRARSWSISCSVWEPGGIMATIDVRRRKRLAVRRETLRALTLSPAALERAAGGGNGVWWWLKDTGDCDTVGKSSKLCPGA